MEGLKVTSPEEYAEKARQANAEESAGFLHRLKKTGAVVRLRRVDVESLVLIGAVPMSLVSATQSEGKDNKKHKLAKNEIPTPEEIEAGNNNLIFMRQTVVENCLEPQIRYFEGVGVFFVNSKGEQIARVDPQDFSEMFAVISGEDGADGLNKFRNRAERRASASQSRRKTLRPKTVGSAEGQPAGA